tara:strand:+ start:1462 stop:2730 length:1269 start_codon:yes stop_codon:yes gene_type:complete
LIKDIKIAVIGLGYVGLPLAIEFSKKYPTIGYDINSTRVNELLKAEDKTLELTQSDLESSTISFTDEIANIKECNVYIITVPTPIDDHKKPDLRPILNASESVGKIIKKGDLIIYESTVYPGVTEDECVPILENYSMLAYNRDFFVGYSPERINPGDKNHTIRNILKIVSGSNEDTLNFIDKLYSSIIDAGTYKASSIKVAEAAKVIENTQRDLNIGLINELALIFNKLDIDTEEVLKAAETKWNFLPFRPGLVGGHCIGVDPYYLTYKAESVGYRPEIILSSRRLNDSMAEYVAARLIKFMHKKGIKTHDSSILILGLTFKENCPDIRNSKVISIIDELKDYGANIDCYDPWIDEDNIKKEHGIKIISYPKKNNYDAVLIAVAHDKFKELGLENIRSFGKKGSIIFDLKFLFNKGETDLRL